MTQRKKPENINLLFTLSALESTKGQAMLCYQPEPLSTI